jgi:hypothetical protein
MTANIRPKADSHKHCLGYANPITSRSGFFYIDDVRTCPHGRVQVVWEPPGRIAGPGCYLWRDIDKFWERGRYKRAVEALRGSKNDTAEGTG